MLGAGDPRGVVPGLGGAQGKPLLPSCTGRASPNAKVLLMISAYRREVLPSYGY